MYWCQGCGLSTCC